MKKVLTRNNITIIIIALLAFSIGLFGAILLYNSSIAKDAYALDDIEESEVPIEDEEPLSEEEILPLEDIEEEEADPIEEIRISTADEFFLFAKNCKDDGFSDNKYVMLTKSIDLSAYPNCIVPVFGGVFNGNFHSITGINIDIAGSNLGLFRYLKAGGAIKYLTIEVSVLPSGSQKNIGGVVGENIGLVEECLVSGQVSGKHSVGGIVGRNLEGGQILKSVNEAIILGEFQTAGIAGINLGLVRECKNSGAINNSDKDISENNRVLFNGGIVGNNLGAVLLSENTGIIGYNDIGLYSGGIAGINFGEIKSSFNNGEVIGLQYIGGIIGNYGSLQTETAAIVTDYLQQYYLSFFSEEITVPSVENVSIFPPSIVYCYNTAEIKAKSSVGGIVGALQGYDSEITYVLDSCFNEGKITTKDRNAGGIVGLMVNGEVTNCFSAGNVSGDLAENIGGIVGNMELGSISYCFSLGYISGESYVGGIAGIGYNIYNCYSLSDVSSNGESYGMIAGQLNGEALFNYFPLNRIGGIDNINYSGKAQPRNVEDMVAMGDAINANLTGFSETEWGAREDKVSFPLLLSFMNIDSAVSSLFKEKLLYHTSYSFDVNFTGENGLISSMRVNYGDAISLEEFPPAPVKENYYVSWESFNNENIISNVIVNAIYIKGLTSISSDETKPLIIIEGLFHPDTQLTIVETNEAYVMQINNYNVKSSYAFTITHNDQSVEFSNVKVKLLAPEGIKNPKIAIVKPSGVVLIDCEVVGSYLTFDLISGTEFMVLTQANKATSALWFYVLGVLILLIIGVLVALKLTKKKTKATTTNEIIPISNDKKVEKLISQEESVVGTETKDAPLAEDIEKANDA